MCLPGVPGALYGPLALTPRAGTLTHLDALQQLHVAVPHVPARADQHPETPVHLERGQVSR